MYGYYTITLRIVWKIWWIMYVLLLVHEVICCQRWFHLWIIHTLKCFRTWFLHIIHIIRNWYCSWVIMNIGWGILVCRFVLVDNFMVFSIFSLQVTNLNGLYFLVLKYCDKKKSFNFICQIFYYITCIIDFYSYFFYLFFLVL